MATENDSEKTAHPAAGSDFERRSFGRTGDTRCLNFGDLPQVYGAPPYSQSRVIRRNAVHLLEH